jgi:hypothetical protein
MNRSKGIGQNMNIDIILLVAFTMMTLENYIFTLKVQIGGFPLRYFIR